jgi:hypothetical protein
VCCGTPGPGLGLDSGCLDPNRGGVGPCGGASRVRNCRNRRDVLLVWYHMWANRGLTPWGQDANELHMCNMLVGLVADG